MKFLSLDEQTEILTAVTKRVFGTALPIGTVEHPEPPEKGDPWPDKALLIDRIFTISCGEHAVEKGDSPKAALSYLLDVAVYMPGTYHEPPDWDVQELGAFTRFRECVRFMINQMVVERVDQALEDVEMTKLAAEIAEESATEATTKGEAFEI